MRAVDYALIEQFLNAVGRSDYSPEAISEAIGGNPSGPTIRRYQRGELPKRSLDPATVAGMRRFITGQTEGPAPTSRAAADEEGSDYNERREEEELARIGALPDPLMRTLERESIAAVIRGQALRDACRAARIEAEKAFNRSEFVWNGGEFDSLPTMPQEEARPPGSRERKKKAI